MTKIKRLGLIARQMAFLSVLLVGCGSPDSARQKLINSANNSAQMPSWEATKQSETGMPDITSETYVAAGRMHETQGRLTRAAAQYRMAIQLDPQNVEAHNRLGLVLCQMQQFNEADAELAKAIGLAPDKPHLHNNLGFSYLVQMRWTEAEQSLRKALDLQPDFARAHMNLGMVLAQQDRFDDAMRHFLAVVPSEDAWFNIGLMYQSKSRPAEAARAFKTALKLSPAMVAARQCLDKLPPDASSSAQPFESLTALASAPKAEPVVPQPPQPPVESVAVAAATQPGTSGQPAKDIRTAETPESTFAEPFGPESEPLVEMAETPQPGPSGSAQESSAANGLSQEASIAETFEVTPTPDMPPAAVQEEGSTQDGPLDPQIVAALMGTGIIETPDGLPEMDLFAEFPQANSETPETVSRTPAAAERAETTAMPMAGPTTRPSDGNDYDFLGGESPKDLFAINWMPEDPAEDQFEIVLSSRPPMPPTARNAVLMATQPSSDAPTPEEFRVIIEALLDLSHSPTDAMPKPYSVPTTTRPSDAAPQSQPEAGQTRTSEQNNMTVEANVPEPDDVWRRPLWDDLEAFGPEEPSGSATSDN